MKKKYKKLNYHLDDYSTYSVSELKKCCDYWLRQYLLSKNSSVYFLCPLKNRNYKASEMEVAHFIDRGIMVTRYDLTNCHLISKQSNTWDAQIPMDGYKSKHHYDYEMWLGEDTVKSLREKSKEIKIFSRQDYIELIEKFKGNE